MAEATRRAKDLSRPTWILALKQLAAKGRSGRQWRHPDGNFAATLFMRPEVSPSEAALRSFAAANAVYSSLSTLVDAEHLSLKWPNDVLYKGGKAAGILLESSGLGPKIDWLSVGIGVNLVSAPQAPDAMFPPIGLGLNISPENFLNQLALAFASEEADLLQNGFASVRKRWLDHAARIGETITARTTKEEITGTFETVDEIGQLVLLTPKGRSAVPAGDVYF